MPRKAVSSLPSLVGTTLDGGRYTLVAELGAGSFAQVYRAEETGSRLRQQTPNSYAVKVLYKPGLTPAQLTTQKNEVKFLKALSDHPNVCRLIKAIDTETQLFLIMELCDTDLFDLIVPPRPAASVKAPSNSGTKPRPGLSEPMVMSIFSQLASALVYAHSKGIYHRDLKPENVLILRDSNTVKLSDFGLATHSKISKEFGCGSVRYMSPECLDSKLSPEGYSPDSNDAWSLGIILINLLTGKNPWVEPKASDVNFALYASEERAASTLRAQFKFSPELATILARLFSPDRSRRPTLSQFADAILHLPYFRTPTMPFPSPPLSIPGLSPPSLGHSLGHSFLATTPTTYSPSPLLSWTPHEDEQESPTSNTSSFVHSVFGYTKRVVTGGATTTTTKKSVPQLPQSGDVDVLHCSTPILFEGDSH